ncbi:phosphate ABC transporter permease [Mycoplasmopsis alligatoris]|uniref:Phosphate ABC transporter, permease protein PstA n=1 Tax=Mycoplasmopsis alligatoris A21JP2 TaxID=747682 RepID=D4XV39_9BACT|nr:ABC transporter permease subunit [Mycoplasmopsis alligatoris]EFF41763.1 phosphate ABC transporter, permease protein PstA [Mycoplasmopsis alligatoris A21JP2]
MKVKQIKNKILNFSSSIFAWSIILSFLAILVTIIYYSIPGIAHYKWSILSLDFNLNNDKAGIWLPLLVTIVIVSLAILISVPIGIKCSVFLVYRVKEKYSKTLRIIIDLLAGFPSVIFGIFALEALGPVLSYVLNLKTTLNIINGSIMLSFMILPTIVSYSYNAFKSSNVKIYDNSLALGITKTKTIYKIVKKDVSSAIYLGVLLSIGRAIGETMALNFILTSQNYNNIFNDTFKSFWESGLKSIGAIISYNFFAENGGESLRGILYFFGLLLFIITMLINGFAHYMIKPKSQAKFIWLKTFHLKLISFVMWLPNKTVLAVKKKLSKSTLITKNSGWQIYEKYKLSLEIISVLTTIAFIAWIIIYILFNGFNSILMPSSTVFSFEADSTGRALVNTILIIFISVIIAFPVALFVAIYISEYLKNKKMKTLLLFLIDALGSTPSIVFGIFGLTFFIQTLGLSAGGRMSNSLIAGALTIALVILTNFIRGIQQSFEFVPSHYRDNAIALGIQKNEFIFKILIPQAFVYILNVLILGIGRVIAETAPLYLTAGLTSSNTFGINLWGQTLTTRILAQINSNTIHSHDIMLESAFIALLLILFLVLLTSFIIPKTVQYINKKRSSNG